MTRERIVRALAGSFVLISAGLGHFVSPWFLVFTAFVGLYAAPVDVHPVVGFAAILFIAVGAGASGALNMWWDADIDAVMRRTSKRPIPAGKVEPGEALALGVAGCDSTTEVEATLRLVFDEARLAARLSHPNLTQVFDFGEDEGALYLVHAPVRRYSGLGVDDVDWVDYFAPDDEPATEPQEEEPRVEFRDGSVREPLEHYAGRFRDPWFGDVTIEMRGDELWFAAAKSPRFEGRLWPYEEHTFYAYWADRTLEADTWVRFIHDEAGNVMALEVEQVSPESDWDFTDLALERVVDD